MPVLAELFVALILGLLAIELDSASRRALGAHNRVTDGILLLDLAFGFTVVLVTVLSMRMVTGLIF